ncbi:hemolysin III family protein [Tissierella creatinini]|nr:hemolysin III family protein [Tissierella creatinini]TJX67500.1 hemolysin III family protein [Soehngenia saccharolytica]
MVAKKYSKFEEIFNSVTHGVGVVFGIVALTKLLFIAITDRNVSEIVGFSIYGVCIILMFLSSTLYHSFTIEKVKQTLRVFDHSSIFLFMAGTYTPIVLLTLDGALRNIILIGAWAIAIAGVLFKILTYGKYDKFKRASVIIYIAMGWFAIFPMKSIVNATSINFFYWILAGGLLYTMGTIFYSNKRIPLNHGIWHLFVLAASITHFLGIAIHLA